MRIPNQKGIAGIVAILIFALFFGGLGFAFYKGYLTLNTSPAVPQNPATQSPSATPQPTPVPSSDASPAPNGAGETANWKIYTDQDLGLSFKYPADDNWKLKTETVAPSNARIVELTLPNETEMGSFPLAMSFSYIENPKNLTIEEYQKELDTTPFVGPHPTYYNVRSSPTVIGEKSGFFTNDVDCSPGDCNMYVLKDKNKIWVINLWKWSYRKYSKEMDQVLSTLKFTR